MATPLSLLMLISPLIWRTSSRTSQFRQTRYVDESKARRRGFADGLFAMSRGRDPEGALYFESSATSAWLFIASLASSPVSVFTTTVPSANT